MEFGLMFFSSKSDDSDNKYQLLIDATKFADQYHFSCIWTPERHFDVFGGLFPNPSVISAALAMITENLQIRSGSLISPLHNPIRIVEEWSVVDNLSNGRVGVSFGSGWNVNDFVFFPNRHPSRQRVMYEQIETVRDLWQGGTITQKNTHGHDVELTIHPKPIQKSLPIWVTAAGHPDTFKSAGRIGANVLTHLANQSMDELAEKIGLYREARRQSHLPPEQGRVSLMLHTFIDETAEQAEAKVKLPLREYLRSAVLLETTGYMSEGQSGETHQMPDDLMEELLDITFKRFVHTSSLIGTVESCVQMVQKVKSIGVDEIACLVDFGVETPEVMQSLQHLKQLKDVFE
ncbi:MAG: LLM class flavin-dependent oxidoreductase [Chloroflexota bacterium]